MRTHRSKNLTVPRIRGWAGTNSKCNIFVCLMIYSTSAAVLLESGKRGLLSTFQWPFEWPLALPILVQ